MTGADWVQLVVVLIGSGGILQFLAGGLKDHFKDKRAAPTKTDQNVLTLAKTRDELVADIKMLREEREQTSLRHARERAESAAGHARERAEWAAERTEMRAEIDALEVKVRHLLDELMSLKSRHA